MQIPVLLSVQFDAWIESHELYPYYQYCTEYLKVFCDKEDITELVRKYPDIEMAIWENLQKEFPRKGKNLKTDIWIE